MIQAGPFHALNRALRGVGYLLVVMLAIWIWRYRELAEPAINRYEAWHDDRPAPMPIVHWQLRVMKTLDGENLQAKDSDGNIYTVRLAGVDAPELRSRDKQERDRAVVSRDYLATLVGTNTIDVVVTLTNAQRMILGIVRRGETNINSLCVESGHARFRRDYLVGTSFQGRYDLLKAERKAESAAEE